MPYVDLLIAIVINNIHSVDEIIYSYIEADD